MILRLLDGERRTLLDRVYSGLAARGATTDRTEFLDGLAQRIAGRAPIAAPFQDEDDALPPPARGDTVLEEVSRFVVDELLVVRVSETFPLISKIAEKRDDAAFTALLDHLNEKIKVRGILYKRGLDPEQEWPGLWSKVWEAIGKWDGRDFLAYIGRVVRNYCTDDLKRRKKAPGEIPEETADRRPGQKTFDRAGSRDAVVHVLSVLDELEADGSLAPIDGVIFALLTSGRAVQDIAALISSNEVMSALESAVGALAGKKKLEAGDVVAFKLLTDGVDADEVAAVTGKPLAAVTSAKKALAKLEDESEDARIMARAIAREGLARQDLERARKLTTNAVNLRINRARLKVWMALCDRAYDTARRRGDIDDVDLAIVQHRCTAEPGAWCRMYKDRTCKRERTPAEIARKAALSLGTEAMTKRVDGLREKILDGLGRAFPDYNACLNERKPDRKGG